MTFGIALAFLAGVFIAGMRWNGLPAFLLLCFLCAGTVGAAVIRRRFLRKHFLREYLLFILAAAAGMFYFHYYRNNEAAGAGLPLRAGVEFAAVVSDEPQPSERFLIVPARLEAPYAGAVTLFLDPLSEVAYGDLLSVRGEAEPGDGAYGAVAVFSPEYAITATGRGFWLREWLLGLKHGILDVYKKALPRDEAALLGGIAFGSKVNFDRELKEAMAASGTTHLVAVSGYNITIVILAASGIFGRFLPRRATFTASTVLIVLFILMVGNAASGVRAAIMGFLALIARELGRRFNMRNAITLTAAGMSIADPAALTGNMSFILSFLSLLGIVYLAPAIKKLFRQEDAGFLGWRESGVTTLSAQLAVLPVLIHSFGRFSVTAIAANILVLSTVPLAMFFGLALAAGGFISLHLAFFIASVAGLILAYQLFVIRLFAGLAVPLPVPVDGTFFIALYYMLLAAFAWRHGNAEKI